MEPSMNAEMQTSVQTVVVSALLWSRIATSRAACVLGTAIRVAGRARAETRRRVQLTNLRGGKREQEC